MPSNNFLMRGEAVFQPQCLNSVGIGDVVSVAVKRSTCSRIRLAFIIAISKGVEEALLVLVHVTLLTHS